MARVRTFIAVELNRGLRADCAALQDDLSRSAGDIKWVEEENLHVTLAFLGDVDDREIIRVCRAVGAVCAALPPFTLGLRGVGAFPNLRRPRTVWAGIDPGADELARLHADLEATLLKQGYLRSPEKQFTPHVTLGRVKSDRPPGPLTEALERQADWSGGECEVAAVQVMASDLRAEGPVYSVLSTARLGG